MRTVTTRDSVLLRCQTAMDRCDSGDLEGAVSSLGEMWPEPRGLEGELYAESLLAVGVLGFCLAAAGNGSHETAKDNLTEASRLFKALGNDKAEIADRWLANCYFRQGAMSEGFDLLEGVIASTANTETLFSASVLNAFGLTECGRWHDALRPLNAVESITDRSPIETARFFNQRGVVFRKLNDTQRSLKDYEKAQYWFEVVGNLRYEAAVLNNLGNLEGDLGNFEAAHGYCQRAERLYTSLGDNGHLGEVKDSQAALLIKQSDYPTAVEVATTGIRMATGDDLCWLPGRLITRGIALARLKSTKAKADFLRAAKQAELSGDLAAAGRAYLTMIEELPLQVKERAEYYRLADSLPVDPERLRTCARKIVDSLPRRVRLDGNETECIREALIANEGNVTKAAHDLGLSGPGLARKIDRNPELIKLRKKKRIRRQKNNSRKF